LLILLGLRGTRARREDGARAWRWLVITGGLGLALGVTGVVLGNPASRTSMAVPVVLSLVLGYFVQGRMERTLTGELVASAALASMGLPVALSDGVGPDRAYGAFAIWVLAFAATTYVVRGIIAAESRAKLLLAPVLAVALVAAAAALHAAPWSLLFAIAPVCAVTAGAVLAGVSPRKLREVGWALAAASTSTAALLVMVLR
jgi:hypothetical protein